MLEQVTLVFNLNPKNMPLSVSNDSIYLFSDLILFFALKNIR